jgi:hypothetical protein
MPLVTIKTGFTGPDGTEEKLTQYTCDWPGCPNPGKHLLGSVAELRATVIVCDQHRRPARPSEPGSETPVRQPRFRSAQS